MSTGRIVLLIIGCVVALLAVALIAVGAVLLSVNHTERDSDGFFNTGFERFKANSYAIVSDDLDVETDGPDWLFKEGRLTTVRLRASSRRPGGRVFIGVGPTRRVSSYLAGSRHDLVDDLDFDPFRVTYRPLPGRSVSPGRPEKERFWAASSHGSGTQSVRWQVTDGNWSVVLMNADAGPGVDVRLSAGAKLGFIFKLGLGLVIGGGILLLGSIVMIVLAVRRRASPPAAAAT